MLGRKGKSAASSTNVTVDEFKEHFENVGRQV